MSFKVKNVVLNNDAVKVLNELMSLDISATSAFKLSRIMKIISSIVEDKLKAEKIIFNKYVKKNEDGSIVIPKDEKGVDIPGAVSLIDVDSFNKEMSELLDVENEIPYDKLVFEDLNLQSAKIKDIIKIEFLFI